ncbi:CBL-interacting serine/threonine-protein kinase 7-like protein [Tanacetum coccineum]|uniref:non-specific serine/threonine protein kinase n=1 Tax=Tanacetum coccineum TaxID=301880 RepID=A0ABQ5AN69_9ASTR
MSNNKQPLDLTDYDGISQPDEAIGFLLGCVEKGGDRKKQHPPTICKVSSFLRDLSESSFNPQLVSIGPIHREDPKLKEFEWLKEFMELASGGELFTQLLRRKRMKEATARFYFQQLVLSLHFCHQNGVAHRDLKPQNILLDKNGNLKICDFGLSALPESRKDGLLHTACGTPAFTAPEIVRGKGYDGAKADAWSCGVILYNLLAGSLPFDDSNLANMYRKIHDREIVFPDCIPNKPRMIIMKLLDPNPKTRMSIESLMNLSWFKKSLKPEPTLELLEDNNSNDSGQGLIMSKSTRMNAFDIISMSSGLNLSGIFEEKVMKKERRFTTLAKADEVEKRVVEVGEKSGFRVKNLKDGVVEMVKGRVVVVAKVMEVVPELLLVEMAAVDGGGGDGDWDEFKVGFEDIIVSWHSDVQQ